MSVVGAGVLSPQPRPQCACLLHSCFGDGERESAELGTGGRSRGQEGKCRLRSSQGRQQLPTGHWKAEVRSQGLHEKVLSHS